MNVIDLRNSDIGIDADPTMTKSMGLDVANELEIEVSCRGGVPCNLVEGKLVNEGGSWNWVPNPNYDP